MIFEQALLPFIAILLSEFGDKTQLTILCLSSRTKKYGKLLLGVMLAFLLTDGLAILIGEIATELIPIPYIKVVSGIIFVLFGISSLMSKDEEKVSCDLKSPFMSGFTMILVSEMGDKSQITAALFGAIYNPWFVLIGTLAALLILSAVAIYMGKFLLKHFDDKIISKAAGVIFIILGFANVVPLFF